MLKSTQDGEGMYNILICDDEKDIVAALKIYLESEGYGTLCAYNGRDALQTAQTKGADLILLDIMMPDMDGIEVLAKLRQTSNIPVIMLTAKSEDTDKILGLNVGADDYVTKPFNPVEVIARVKSQLRRYTQLGGAPKPASDKSVYTVGAIELNDATKEVTAEGVPVSLTPTEYEILKLFMQNPGTVLSPREIYRRVWNDEPYGAESTVAVHIRHLREKIEINPADPVYLRVVWAQGYKLVGGTKNE